MLIIGDTSIDDNNNNETYVKLEKITNQTDEDTKKKINIIKEPLSNLKEELASIIIEYKIGQMVDRMREINEALKYQQKQEIIKELEKLISVDNLTNELKRLESENEDLTNKLKRNKTAIPFYVTVHKLLTCMIPRLKSKNKDMTNELQMIKKELEENELRVRETIKKELEENELRGLETIKKELEKRESEEYNKNM
ncbi:19272_t:CDS:2 [Racocetra fulgida]|uniref:19272_t:CDS:1 n=2 Tax=Racocetra fulgida TaxID=60492 RepID=A0A9N8WBY7_9GLOM|nr:19272_t:CDS:2 [Racocetra fulgida]